MWLKVRGYLDALGTLAQPFLKRKQQKDDEDARSKVPANVRVEHVHG